MGKGRISPPSLKYLCALKLGMSFLIAVASFIGLFVAVWLCVDLTASHNSHLWDLSQYTAQDTRVLTAGYVFIGAAILGPLLALLYVLSRGKGDEATSFSSTMQVVALAVATLLVLLHMSIAIMAGLYTTQFLTHLGPNLITTLSNTTYMQREPNARWIYMEIGEKFNYLQTRFRCCGVYNPDDYDLVNFANRYEKETFPYSCCLLKEEAIWTDPDVSDVYDLFLCKSKNPDAFHGRGCLQHLNRWLKSKADFLVGYSLFLMFLTFLLVVLTIYVICNVSDKPF